MMILGIDTSCDDTSAGVMLDGKQSSVQCRSLPGSAPSPLRRSRSGTRFAGTLGKINTVVEQALDKAGIARNTLDGSRSPWARV